MAIEASKSKNLSSQYNNSYISKGTITAYFKENSSSIDNNTSNIYVKASIYTPSASWANTNGVSDHLRIYWHDNKSNSDVLKATWSGTSVGVGATITAEATFNVEHNSDGKLSGYAWATWSRDGNNGYAPYSTDVATDWTDLTSIPRAATITTAPNFNDTGNPVLKYSNPAGTAVSSLQACIANTAGNTTYAAYRDISKTGTSYTFNLTTAERNALRAATPNSNTLKVKYYVKTVIGSNTYYKSSEATLSIVEANPTFSAFTYRDTNTAVTDITGNDQYLVQGKSTLRATVPAANKASAKKSATMSSYAASISGLSATGNYSASADVDMDFSSNAFTAGSQALTVKAIDSRGNSTSVTKNVTVLAYSAPVINASATRLNNFENDTTLVIKGSYSPLTIDSAAKNTVTSVQYRYKKQSSTTWSAWTNMPGLSVAAAGTYTTTNKVLDLSNTDAWDIQVRTIDRFSTTTASMTVSVGIPTMRIGTDGYVYNQEEPLMRTHIGQVIMSTTLNTAAKVHAIYGGTWEAWGQGRVPVGVDPNDTDFNAPNKTGGSKTVTLQVSQIPAHNHAQNINGNGGDAWNNKYGAAITKPTNTGSETSGYAYASDASNWNNKGNRIKTDSTGSGQAHDNMSPYRTVYMWLRIS